MTDQTPENPWVEGVKTLGLSAILALGIRTFIAEARYIPSESMLPTLEINDRLIVEKVTYYFSTPERGDMIVFLPPETPETAGLKDAFIKRVIGLPGDMVEVREGTVFVNHVPLSESYIYEAPKYDYGPAIVPEDEYLVLGDNRNNSFDSAKWGFVPRDRIIGRAAVRFWPPARIGTIYPQPLYPQTVPAGEVIPTELAPQN